MYKLLIFNFAVIASTVAHASLTETQFTEVMKQSELIYSPIFAAQGMSFEAEANWESDDVNGHAENWGELRRIVIFGGLPRVEHTNADGIRALFCHEVGHHLGGAPFRERLDLIWSSSEGQADYWAASVCLKKLFLKLDNKSYLQDPAIPKVVSKKCNTSFKTEDERLICVRSSLAGYNLMEAFNQRFNKGNYFRDIDFATPDRALVPWSWPRHSNFQCRTDTYFQGSLCNIVGVCRYDSGASQGLRPRCWFAPEDENNIAAKIFDIDFGAGSVHKEFE